ncbi:MAG: leucyl aminopeptidase [Deltaproteobacteria bacterium]|nr:leucyl aminopeptidase [Deltaproteobacteria bacterium]
MNVKLIGKKAGEVVADVVVVAVREGHELTGAVARFPKALRTSVTTRAKRTHFKGKVGSTLSVQGEHADMVLVGVGDGAAAEHWRRAASAARGAAASAHAATLALALDDAEHPAEILAAALEGLLLAGYSFDKYRTKKDDGYRGPKSVTLSAPSLKVDARNRASVDRTQAVCDAVALARDLVNEMSTLKTPGHLASVALGLARRGRVSCEVWQGERLRREKLHGILAVSAGSRHPGALIKMVYKPRRRSRSRIAIVGKGITFDSGGLSLKPAKSMETMKMDMSGAALVLALMKALPVLEASVEVHGFIAAAENMPGHGAQKPGDVIRYRNGVTAEVLNTDAEGRLVLADALCLATEIEPDCIIDAATLTGACMVALGTRVAGILGNDQELIDALIACGTQAGEPLWQLPLVEDYMEDIRSSVADIKNVGGGYAGTISAALFLRSFIGKTKWAHLDIAGPAFTEKPLPYTPKGGTGFAIRTLLAYLDSIG